MVASNTAWGGGKSGSPTHKLVTVSPLASICFTRLNTSTVLLILTFVTSGFSSMALLELLIELGVPLLLLVVVDVVVLA